VPRCRTRTARWPRRCKAGGLASWRYAGLLLHALPTSK
jgi:hypothetical protein